MNVNRKLQMFTLLVNGECRLRIEDNDIVKDGRYKDLHEGNVMIHPETEQFLLIDLEGFCQGEPNLDWLDKEILLS
jgi:hypothetical protein